jgi:acyl-[acyl-carrier-protein]-phospholipid O-acyltransferase/long-chain-fatty-acid--[acyl-carrier-protein] ligase
VLGHALWPEEHHAVVAVPDKRKGERIVLVTTAENAPPTNSGNLAGNPAPTN